MHIYDLIVANKDDKESIKKIKDYLKLCQNKQMDFNIVFFKTLCHNKLLPVVHVKKKEETPLIDIISSKVRDNLPMIEFLLKNNVENKLHINTINSKYEQVINTYQSYNIIENKDELIEFSKSLDSFNYYFDNNYRKIKLLLDIDNKIVGNNISENNLVNKFNTYSQNINGTRMDTIVEFSNELTLYLNINSMNNLQLIQKNVQK